MDVRRRFLAYDPHGLGWVSESVFINALDTLHISEQLNDQETLTVIRRFKDGEKYLYPELADLFSHVASGRNRPRKSSQVLENSADLPGFLLMARSRSTQWRRWVIERIYCCIRYRALPLLRLWECLAVRRRHWIIMITTLSNGIVCSFFACCSLFTHWSILRLPHSYHDTERFARILNQVALRWPLRSWPQCSSYMDWAYRRQSRKVSSKSSEWGRYVEHLKPVYIFSPLPFLNLLPSLSLGTHLPLSCCPLYRRENQVLRDHQWE